MSAASSAHLANASSVSPPLPPFASSSLSPSPSPIIGDDQHKHQQQIKSSFRRAIQLIAPPKEQRESAEIKRERETNTEQQQEKTREKQMPSLPAVVPCSSTASSPLCAPMDNLSQFMASFAAVHQNQQQQRNAPLSSGAPPAPSFMPNGAQFSNAGPFLSSAHPPPPDFNSLLAIAPPGVLGPFIAGGIVNAPFIPPPSELLFTQHPPNQHQSINGTTNANNSSNMMPSGVSSGPPFPFSFDPVMLATYKPYMGQAEARRKNATREVTAPLKYWLNQHRKNPYPTKAEKTVLAVITNMTMTQVSTWFANARRRLKKENKMTWSPRNRPNDEDDFLEMDERAEGTTAQTIGAEGPSSPELELEEEQDEEQNVQTQQNTISRDMEQRQQRQRRGIWSIADTLGEEEKREGDNAKSKEEEEEEEEPSEQDEAKDHRSSKEEESEGEKAKVKLEIKTEQQLKCEQSLQEHQQRTELSNSGLNDHCAVNVLPSQSPQPPPPGPHTVAPSPLDFLIGSPHMPPAHPMLLPFPPADFPNARHNLFFALQQNQLHHQRSLMAAANPMIAAMFLAQQFAAHQQQMEGMTGGGKQVDGAVTALTAAEQQHKEKDDEPEEKRQQQQERNNATTAVSLLPQLPSHHQLLLPLPPPPPFVRHFHQNHLSPMSPTSSVLAGQKRAAAAVPMPTESADNGIALPKRQCRAET